MKTKIEPKLRPPTAHSSSFIVRPFRARMPVNSAITVAAPMTMSALMAAFLPSCSISLFAGSVR